MVYVDPKNLGYMPYWQRWLASRPNPNERDSFGSLFNRYVPTTLRYILEGIKGSTEGDPLVMAVPQTALNLVCFCSCINFNQLSKSCLQHWIFTGDPTVLDA